ncbi:histidine phosphatase family protein [Leucobacter sp. CSA2]|uniref:Histidine phosphatase family protein n=1 Tax=Leucobacter edaphi TaxID=2796472 RepID=A0A934QBQ7_9MICO|nr:histidine phosphatase family protein [Leucobacter edaphi]MBK0421691.1 histidine phosphatase family protein [Leucobacter edaphi]
MHELILVRHAKSDWGDPGIADHDRPLNARGLRDAPAMASRLAAELGAEVGEIRIVASTAERARATAEAFAAALGTRVEFDRGLYLAPPSALLARAAEACSDGADTVLIVAHDPGLSELAHVLSDGGIDHLPTCAVARFELDAEALEPEPGAGSGGGADRAPGDARFRPACADPLVDAWSLDTPRGQRVPRTTLP